VPLSNDFPPGPKKGDSEQFHAKLTVPFFIQRVAHVVESLSPEQSVAQYITILVSALKAQGIESTIITPETSNNLHESGISIAFLHSSASLRPARVHVRVHHESNADAQSYDGHIFLFENARLRAGVSGNAVWIPPASDIEAIAKRREPVTKQSMGLESAGSISATFGPLSNVSGREYLRVLAEIMTRFPRHYHLFAGIGNVRTIRPYLHSEGVLPRVRFLGPMNDIASVIPMIDVYLTPFPDADPRFVLDAMGMEKPVLVRRYATDSPLNSAAELVGIRELSASKEMEYIEIADRLLRNNSFRAEQGQATYDRFRAEFRPAKLGERYKTFLTSLADAGTVL